MNLLFFLAQTPGENLAPNSLHELKPDTPAYASCLSRDAAYNLYMAISPQLQPTQTDLLKRARAYLVSYLKGKQNTSESKHPWRKDWEFAVLHSLRVETYAQKILAREQHTLSGHHITLIRLAAVLHDIGRLDKREGHAKLGAEIAAKWLHNTPGLALENSDAENVLRMIANHSNKSAPEPDFSLAVLKDADILDEIGVMSIFMTSNWLKTRTPYFFYSLRQRLIDYELPFCDKQMALLNTHGARQILGEKKAFVQSFITQLGDELQAGDSLDELLPGWARQDD